MLTFEKKIKGLYNFEKNIRLKNISILENSFCKILKSNINVDF